MFHEMPLVYGTQVNDPWYHVPFDIESHGIGMTARSPASADPNVKLL